MGRGNFTGQFSHLKIRDLAQRILEEGADPVVAYLLRRDILDTSVGELWNARKALCESENVRKLAEEQRDDGGWGPFHSRSTRLKQYIPSTEVGVERALTLGLDIDHPILRKARGYIVGILEGRTLFPDHEEKNDRWLVGKQLILSSTLALIDPSHDALKAPRKLWLEVARRTFKTGAYSGADEIKAHTELTRATVKDSYLVLRSRYHLVLLGSDSESMPCRIKNAYLDWLWKLKHGMGYLDVPLRAPPPIGNTGPLDRWFASHELLSSQYPSDWAGRARDAIGWLLKNQMGNGRWDLGPRAPAQHYFPLSENWRAKRSREIDWTARALILLQRYRDARAQIDI